MQVSICTARNCFSISGHTILGHTHSFWCTTMYTHTWIEGSLLLPPQSHMSFSHVVWQLSVLDVAPFYYYFLQGKKLFYFPLVIHRSVWIGSIHCSSHYTCYCHSGHRQGLGRAVSEARLLQILLEAPQAVPADWYAGILDIGPRSWRQSCSYKKMRYICASESLAWSGVNLCIALFAENVKSIVSSNSRVNLVYTGSDCAFATFINIFLMASF